MTPPEPPDLSISDPLGAMLGFQLRRASVAVMMALAEELATLGLNPGEASLLLFIGANEGVTQSDIGRAMRAQPANLQPLVHKLWQAGALDRVAGKGRAIALSLSDEGRVLCEKVSRAFARNEARITRRVPAERRAEMIELLRLICMDACRPGGRETE
ncbi:MarR family transcriptional regulator [Sphingomonas oligophenolica]|uniref:MarR family transcriptional regulator n=1 Tax=Sphingomonas oligophenolica TaxID=301154 RepID=A0ABU9XYC0_9SPHN